MKFKSYTRAFIGKINEIHILVIEKSIREIPGIFQNILGYIPDRNRTGIPGIKPWQSLSNYTVHR